MTRLFHGTWWDRHQPDPLDALMTGRFTRLFPENPAQFPAHDLEALAHAMTSHQERRSTPEDQRDPEEDPEIMAAYTYLGQFTDHDLTYDPTSRLREALTDKELEALADFRTPRFDLDNLYGRGPDDQPYMYEPDGIHMLLGQPMLGNPFDPDARQVPRGPNGRALIGDPRNDENRIVAQLHAIFLRFHNQVADYLAQPSQLGKNVTFDAVRQQVRHHYQWVLVRDYLPKIINSDTYESIFSDPYHPTPRLPGLQNGLGLMPVEFSVAAFRLHSMIRPLYRLNTTVARRPIFLPGGGGAHVDDAADLRGFCPIPGDWAIDWQFFLGIEHTPEPREISPLYDPDVRRPQHAYKIGPSLVSPLGHLPPEIASHPSMLALRTLERGNTFRLPSGQAVAEALGESLIADDDLVVRKSTAEDDRKPLAHIAGGLVGNTPLWTYTLIEAQVTSWENAEPGVSRDDIPIKLGPVGGRIVAGVFAALLLGDRTSYVNHDTAFTPIPDFSRDGKFGLAELIRVALRPRQGTGAL